MSLLRAYSRPLASLYREPVARAFSTSCSQQQDSRNATSQLLNTIYTEEMRANRPPRTNSPRYDRKQVQNRDPASRSAGGTMSDAAYGRNLIEKNMAPTPDLEASWLKDDLLRQMPRRWREGDIYAPHDLSGVEARKWRRTRRTPTLDVFDALALDPLKEYKNFSIMSQFMTEMGRIRHSTQTGLRPVNQRRIAKAIRRAIGIGIMPSVHVHPELIQSSSGSGLSQSARR